MNKKISDPRLLQFCAGNIFEADGCVFDIDTPWRDGDWDYASDRRIMVRAPAVPGTVMEVNGYRLPNAAEYFSSMAPPKDAKWKPWPTIHEDHARYKCPFCNMDGTTNPGRKHVSCEYCTVRCLCPKCSSSHICSGCDECNGTGKKPRHDILCPACRGTGLIPIAMFLAGRRIGGWYLWLIDSLGVAEYCEDGRDESAPLLFRASGNFEGLVRGCKPECLKGNS